MTEEVMMVPTQEFERLQDYYKGQISQSALLNKAGRLAAEKHLILSNPKIPDATAVRMTKPLAREQARLTKRIRTGTCIPAGAGMPSEAMVDSPLENLLKKIIEKEVPAAAAGPATPATPVIKKEPVAGPSGIKIKKESKSVKPPIPPKPFVSAKKPKSTGGIKKAAFLGATKALLKPDSTRNSSIATPTTTTTKAVTVPKRKPRRNTPTPKRLLFKSYKKVGKSGTNRPEDPWAMTRTKPRRSKRIKRKQRGRGFNLQSLLNKTGIKFHWPGYQYMGPRTRLKRGDPGINRLDRIAKQHDIDYSHAKNLQDKWKADAKMINAIDKLPGSKTLTERIVKRIMQAKKRFKL